MIGNCEKGYEGNLCHHCSENFSRRFDRLCFECPEENLNKVLLVIVGVIVVIFFVLMIQSGIKSAYTPKSVLSVYLKVAWNYLQVIMVINSLNCN